MNRREIKLSGLSIKSEPLHRLYIFQREGLRFRFYRFFLFRNDAFTRAQPPISVTGHWHILTYGRNIRIVGRAIGLPYMLNFWSNESLMQYIYLLMFIYRVFIKYF